MEGEGSGCLGSGGAQGGIPHSLSYRTTTILAPHALRILRSLLRQRPGSREGNRQTAGSRSGGTSSSSRTRVLQPPVCGPQGFRLLETSNRSKEVEQAHQEDQVSDGDSPVSPLSCPEERLDDLHRPERCLPTGSDTPREQEVPPVLHNNRDLSIQDPVFRPVNSSTSLHKGDGSSIDHSSQHGNTSNEIPGRLVSASIVQGRMPSGEGNNRESLPGTWNHDKFREIVSDTNSGDKIPRDDHQFRDFEGFTFNRETEESISINRRISFLKSPTCISLAKAPRPPFIHESAGLGGQIENEIFSVEAPKPVGFQERESSDNMGPTVKRRPPLVDEERTSESRTLPPNTTTRSFPMDRCFGQGMGSASLEPVHVRSLDERRETPLNKSQGTQSDKTGPTGIQRPSTGQSGSSLLGQHLSNSIFKKPRGNDVTEPQQGSTRDPQVVRGQWSNSSPAVPSRVPECDCGLTVKTKRGTGSGVDSLPTGGRQTDENLASNSRPLRNIPQLSSSSLLRTLPGSDELGNRCLTPELGQPARICLSSLSPDKEGPQQNKTVKRVRSDNDSSVLASERVVPRLAGVNDGTAPSTSNAERSTQTTSLPQIPPEHPRAASSCVATFQRFARHEGFSSRVAKQLALARRRSTNLIYQQKWSIFRKWCRDKGVSVSRPTLPKIADFLLDLKKRRNLSETSIKGYRSMLAYVFRLKLPEISSSPVLKDLIRSFSTGRSSKPHLPPSWDLNKVLNSLMSSPFEPLREASLRNLTKKTLFLLSLASAKRIGEIQAISSKVAQRGIDLSLSYIPEFVAKTESPSNPVPRHLTIKSLSEFAAGLEEELLLCPVRAINCYLERTKSIKNRPRNLFLSPKCPQKAISKNAVSFFLRETISDADARMEDGGHRPRAHSIRGVGTSMSFWRNWSVSRILEAATWRSNSVFTSFYLKDVEFIFENCRSLGPFVSAGQVINEPEPANSQYNH